MKNYAITSGQFTAKGNFTGYTAKGERLHIHKAQMDSLGVTKKEDLKFPFYAIGENKKIGQLDENGAPKVDANNNPVLVDRLTATSVFASKEAIINAHVEDATLNMEITQSIKAKATTAGLTEADVKALLELAV